MTSVLVILEADSIYIYIYIQRLTTVQGIASNTIPSHCTILLIGLIAEWILIS